jgi:hypothetical protein
MNKQVRLFSIDTKAFYTEKEREINSNVFAVRNKMKVIEECEAIKFILSSDKYFTQHILDNIFGAMKDNCIYAYYFNQENNYKALRKKINEDDYIETDADLEQLKAYKYYFKYINKLLKDNKTYKKDAEYSKVLQSSELYQYLCQELRTLNDEMRTEHTNNLKLVRELNKLACYDAVKDSNDNIIDYTAKSYKQISLFTSYLTDVLEIESDVLTTDLVIVRVYHYDVLDCLINNNFTFLGKEFVAFGASAGQTRTKKCVFISKEILDKYINTLMCGLTKEKINSSSEKGCNITKWLAYQSLINSATDKWTSFDINKAIVIPDWKSEVIDTVDYIKTEKIKKPVYETVYLEGEDLEKEIELAKKEKRKPRKTKKILVDCDEILAITDRPVRQEMSIPITHSDGCGWILDENTKMFRLPWFKGLLVHTDYVSFINEFCNGDDAVVDIDGKIRHLIAEDIKYVFTLSQWKMAKYYDDLAIEHNKENGTDFKSWDMYKYLYNKYNCHARTCNEEKAVFKDANINYQMCQTLTNFSTDDLNAVCQDTVDYIVNSYSNINSMLDVLGCNKEKISYFQQALKLYPELLRDKYTYNELTSSLSKVKKNAKFAKIKVDGKYTFLSPDTIGWMKSVFNCTVNVDKIKILLKDECYCSLFRNAVKLAVLRSPHLYREWAICNNKAYKKDSDLQKAYYNTNCVYTSSLSTISKTLQFDNDGDSALCLADPKWIEIAEKNMKDIVPLFYEMGKAKPRLIDNKAIYEGMITAYKYSNIGQYSNLLTAGWNSNKNDKLDILKIICALNNYSIDAGKTLEMVQIYNEEISDELSTINKLKLPHFFEYAKDKEIDKLEPINDSFVNQICAKFENIDKTIKADANKRRALANPDTEFKKDCKQLFNFSTLGKFNYKNLMSTKNKVAIDQKIIDLYNEVNENKSEEWLEAKKDKDSYHAIYSDCKKMFNDYCINNNVNIVDIADMLVQYVYTDEIMKERKKTLLWEVFGRQIVDNIKANVKRVPDGYFKCDCCKRIKKKKSNNQKRCSNCK